MQDHRDIYRAPEKEPERKPDLPSFEPTPAEVRARTWRNTTGFLLIMVIILAAAAWFIYDQEKKAEDRKLDTAGLPAPGPAATDAAPARITTPEPVVSLTEEEKKLDPERMARAMAETRTANDYLRARNWDQAEWHAKRALEIAPGMNAATRLLGVVYTQRGQFDQAIAVLEQALKTNPYSAETYNNLATAYLQKGQFDRAEELLQTALQIEPEYSFSYLNLGLIYLARARYDAAAEALERGIERVPNDPAPRVNLAVALIRLGRFDEARKHMQSVLLSRPDIPNTYFNMAITYVLENNYAEAMNWIRQGAQRCSPVLCQKFLSDADFNPLRNTPEFQELLNRLYPDLPTPPQG